VQLIAPIIEDSKELIAKPSVDVMTPCGDLLYYESKDVAEILKVIAFNAEKFFLCASGKKEAILFINTNLKF
jgi:hypothetical protein